MNTIDTSQKALSGEQRDALLSILQARFAQAMKRHHGIAWANVQAKLEAQPAKLWSLNEMERTGGEPDVVGYDPETDQYLFFDCSTETPEGRRSICYDRAALNARKQHKPATTAMDMATEMGIELLSEADYWALQQLGAFDTKTSSWLLTPPEIRKLGGALFGDYRYNHVFVYHSGADSYYAVRGFRGLLRV